jgi:hypothetical protein
LDKCQPGAVPAAALAARQVLAMYAWAPTVDLLRNAFAALKQKTRLGNEFGAHNLPRNPGGT